MIYHGPQNQTLPTDGSAVLPCLASGEPTPNIIWLKGRSPLNTNDRRINIAESGSLEISSKISNTVINIVFEVVQPNVAICTAKFGYCHNMSSVV